MWEDGAKRETCDVEGGSGGWHCRGDGARADVSNRRDKDADASVHDEGVIWVCV